MRAFWNTVLFVAFLAAAACSSTPSPIQPPPPNPALQMACPAQLVRDASSPQGTDVHFDAPVPTGGRPPYQVNCTPGSGNIFAIGETSVSCTATDADMAQASCGFTVSVRVRQTIAKTKFVAFGDSITAGAISLVPFITLAPADTYPAKLEEALRARYPSQEIVVLNRGFGGEQTNRGATRLPTVLDADHPQVVLILEGVNASWRLAVDVQAEAIRSMILASQQRGVDVILATVMAVTEEWEADNHVGAITRIKELNTRIKQMAVQYKLGPVVDLYAIFDANQQLLGPDGLHPTAEGQTRIAEAFRDEIVRRYDIPATDQNEPDTSGSSSLFRARVP
jgi:lysophospholipase L1-like esterase